ncbi:MAG: nucleotide exchange factor GrpE [Promethearchaeota archaeon]|nr:MAG: nucleotide exchange factor GrpE [Candidatus Lokiarchaeota archaeon]
MNKEDIPENKEDHKQNLQINNSKSTKKEEKVDIGQKSREKEEKQLSEEEKEIQRKKQLMEELKEYSKEDLINKILYLQKEVSQEAKNFKELSDKVKEKEEAIQNWKDKYMRLQAEFENSQKRWEKSRQTLRSQTIANVLKSFLPLYDSFKKAVSDEKTDDSIRQFYSQFMSILKFFGVEPLKTEENDKFDYNYHEALSTIEKEDIPPNTIIDVIQDGIKINNDVLRYAKVITSRKPAPKPKPKPKEKKELETSTYEKESKKTEEDEEKTSKDRINEEKEKISPKKKEDKKDS